MARMAAPCVQQDFLLSHNRSVSANYLKDITDDVGALALEKQESWSYPDWEIDPREVATLSLGIDGTSMNIIDGGGWREAMVGTISAYDMEGNRLGTIYEGRGPQYGKEKFLSLMDTEWNKARNRYPNAVTQGLADGANWIWPWLAARTDYQVLDFWHLSEYIGKAAVALYKKDEEAQKAFKTEWCHYIKHHCRGVYKLIEHLEGELDKRRTKIDREALRIVIGYLKNYASRTNYLREIENNRPIGSGVTEASCKRLIKERMCKAGMRWKLKGAEHVIALRSLLLSIGRFEQFWDKIMQYGGYRALAVTFKKRT
jgi:hypothetical protein